MLFVSKPSKHDIHQLCLPCPSLLTRQQTLKGMAGAARPNVFSYLDLGFLRCTCKVPKPGVHGRIPHMQSQNSKERFCAIIFYSGKGNTVHVEATRLGVVSPEDMLFGTSVEACETSHDACRS